MSLEVFPSITDMIKKANISPLPLLPLPFLTKKIEKTSPIPEETPKTKKNTPPVYIRNQVKFTPEEDIKLTCAVNQFGMKNWRFIAEYMKTKNARQCQERWYNHLNPSIIKTPWTEDEDSTLLRLYNSFGPKWMLIAKCMKNRSPDNVRNRWKLLTKKLKK